MDKIYIRPDENLEKEEAIDKATEDILLWLAGKEEEKGNTDNANRLREEARK